MFQLRTRLAKTQAATLALTAVSEFFLFIGTITPSWQVADDTDVGRSIQSGLWMYCPGQGQGCWYIFSDDLINYYERVDVCRFFLIGDCRKKLLRTPYFFGWHYAVLIIMLITMSLGIGAMVALGIGMVRPPLARVTTVVMDALLAFAFLLCCIGLAVFLINAEMLESRFLIGVKKTFEKHYGYSFFLACFGGTLLLFALLLAIFLTSTVFFMRDADAGIDGGGLEDAIEQRSPQLDSRMTDFAAWRGAGDLADGGGGYNKMVMMQDEPLNQPMRFTDYNNAQRAPRFCYSPSDVTSIP